MILMSAMTTILFLGGWLPPFENEFFDLIPGFVWFMGKMSFYYLFFMGKSNFAKI